MLKALNQYGAVTAKVRAMYGKMLTYGDWQKLCGMTSTGDIAAYLRGCPGWKTAMSQMRTAPPEIRRLEDALRLQVYDEYERLYNFISREDRKYMRFTVYRVEYGLILSALRRLLSLHSLSDEDLITDFFREKSRADLDAIIRCTDFPGLLAAVQGSIFEDVLQDLPRMADTGLPDYSQASIYLDNRYYSGIYTYLTKGYSGLGKKMLIESIGTQADFLNIIHLLRLRRFPGSGEQASRMLIPIRYKLKDEFAAALISTRTDEEALALLHASRWGGSFADFDRVALERNYDRAMVDFCKKLINSPQPSLCIPQAYLSLKDNECRTLIRVIEAVRYRLDPTKVL